MLSMSSLLNCFLPWMPKPVTSRARELVDDGSGFVEPGEKALGVVKISVQSADLPLRNYGKHLPKISVSARIAGRPDWQETTLVKDGTWKSFTQLSVLVYTIYDDIEIRVQRHHNFRRPTLLGFARHSFATLEAEPQAKVKNLQIDLLNENGTERTGDLRCDMSYYPATTSANPQRLSVDLQTTGDQPATVPQDGIVTIHLDEAKDLEFDIDSATTSRHHCHHHRSITTPQTTVVASIQILPVYQESLPLRCLNIHSHPVPVTETDEKQSIAWHSSRNFYCRGGNDGRLVVRLFDAHDPARLYGEREFTIESLLTEASKVNNDHWYDLVSRQGAGGKIRMAAWWTPVSGSPI